MRSFIAILFAGCLVSVIACGGPAQNGASGGLPAVTASPNAAVTPTAIPPRMVATRTAASSPRPPTPTAATSPMPLPDTLQRVVELTNEQRREAGLDPLQVSGDLVEAAESYAQTMAETDCFGHHCGPVPDQVNRIEQAGYTDWSHLGENVAVSPTTAEEVVEGWMNSPPHRDNILEPAFTEIGVGRATASGRTYWVQEFGKQFGDQ